MTYQEALKARARVAYEVTGINKQATALQKKAEDGAGATDPAAGAGAGGGGDSTFWTKPNSWGVGTGAAAGLGIGAGAYGLMGLFPSLRKRRLLRALIALGVGAGGGAAAGYGVAKNYDYLAGKAQQAGDYVSGKANQAWDWTKGLFGGGKKPEGAGDAGGDAGKKEEPPKTDAQ